MRPSPPSSLGLTLVALLCVGLAGCSNKTPEERIDDLRSLYTAEVNQGGFYVRQEPVTPPEVGPGEEETAATVGEEVVQAGAPPAVPVRQDVILDILVQHDSDRKLPGVTIDIGMESPEGVEKGHWRLFVDTADLEKGTMKQVSHVLEDVDYQAGDRFEVSVRHPIPPAERGEYREFSLGLP